MKLSFINALLTALALTVALSSWMASSHSRSYADRVDLERDGFGQPSVLALVMQGDRPSHTIQ